MADDRTGPKKPGPRVDVDIAPRLRKERRDPRDLRLVLVGVRLDVSIRIFAFQGSRGVELRLSRGHREPRRDRVVEPAAAAPALDQRLALVVAALSGVHERFRRVAVHHHLAGDHAHGTRLRLGEERVDGARMHGAIDHRGRGARADELVEKERGDPRAMLGIGESLFFDESVIIEPVEQLRAVGAGHLGLRIMDVRVDEPRTDQAARMIVDERAGRRALKDVARFADRLDEAASNQDRSVLDERTSARAALGRIAGERENAAANDAGGRGQGRMSLSRSAAIRSISANAVFVSTPASLARRVRKAARMSALLLPLTAMMKGKPNFAR